MYLIVSVFGCGVGALETQEPLENIRDKTKRIDNIFRHMSHLLFVTK
jgi:hypothetical protein